MNDMDLDRAAASSGLTREELLKRAAVGGAVILLAGSAVLAVLAPTRRATRIDPALVLKGE